MRPGVEVRSRAARSARGEPTDNGVWFVADFAERGPHDVPVKVTSLDEVTRTFGRRVAYSTMFDVFDAFFSEGGAEAYVAREVGPAPVKASRILVDRAGVPLNTLRIDALYVGDYANGATGGLTVTVQAGTNAGTYRLIIEENGNEVERFDNLTTPADAVAATAASSYVRAVDLASVTAAPNNQPALVADANLTGGTDDRAAATDVQLEAALNLFTKDLGPGQVSAPARTTTAVHTLLINHARTRNRTFALDVPDRATKATLLTAVRAVDDLVGAEFGGMFGSWFDIPGLTAGTTRAVPGSAYAAAKMARVDALEGTSGAAAAGEASRSDFAIGVRLPAGGFTEQDYEELNAEGVNMARAFRNRGVQMYGFRSITNDPDWIQLTANRLRVSLAARLDARAQRYVFKKDNGKGSLFSDLNGELAGECLKDYQAGALYGATPQEAFFVDTGPTVNTLESIANGEIHAVVSARFSPFAELVVIDILKHSITAPVAA